MLTNLLLTTVLHRRGRAPLRPVGARGQFELRVREVERTLHRPASNQVVTVDLERWRGEKPPANIERRYRSLANTAYAAGVAGVSLTTAAARSTGNNVLLVGDPVSFVATLGFLTVLWLRWPKPERGRMARVHPAAGHAFTSLARSRDRLQAANASPDALGQVETMLVEAEAMMASLGEIGADSWRRPNDHPAHARVIRLAAEAHVLPNRLSRPASKPPGSRRRSLQRSARPPWSSTHSPHSPRPRRSARSPAGWPPSRRARCCRRFSWWPGCSPLSAPRRTDRSPAGDGPHSGRGHRSGPLLAALPS